MRNFAIGDKVRFKGEYPYTTYTGIVIGIVDNRTVKVRWNPDWSHSAPYETEVGNWNERLQLDK